MNKTYTSLLTSSLSLGLVLASSADAHAYCTWSDDPALAKNAFTWNVGASDVVPVYLIADGTFHGLDSAEVSAALGRVVDSFNRYNDSNFKYWNGGILSTRPPQGSVWGVFIQEIFACEVNTAAAQIPTDKDGNDVEVARNNDPYQLDIVINNQAGVGGCQHDWQLTPDFTPCGGALCPKLLQGTIAHELAHAAGLSHNQTCDGKGVGVLSPWGPGNMGGGSEYLHLSRDDIEGLNSLYGRATYVIDYHHSDDGGLSWSDGALWSNRGSQSAISSVSTATAAGEDTNYFGAQRKLQSQYGDLCSIDEMSVDTSSGVGGGNETTFHPTPVAYDGATIVAARFVNETFDSNLKRLQWAWSDDDGATWSEEDARVGPSAIATRRNGLAVAYDPNSTRFVTAYVGDNNNQLYSINRCSDAAPGDCDEVRVVTRDMSSGDQQHTYLGVRTAVGPSLACADDAAQDYNCLLTWVDNTASACLHWGHGAIEADGSFTLLNDLSTDCRRADGPAFVTYDFDEPNTPWRLSFTKQVPGSDDRIFTLRKPKNYGVNWTDLRSFVVEGGFRIHGGMGVIGTGERSRLHAFYARYL